MCNTNKNFLYCISTIHTFHSKWLNLISFRFVKVEICDKVKVGLASCCCRLRWLKVLAGSTVSGCTMMINSPRRYQPQTAAPALILVYLPRKENLLPTSQKTQLLYSAHTDAEPSIEHRTPSHTNKVHFIIFTWRYKLFTVAIVNYLLYRSSR